ncbi:ABC-type Fe3+-siderophore transporter, permease component [Thiohalobacter thiocyanaticus]|uniref:ABC-type Fe3+-siderophore transporter, permease component n=1 Tax=Thiohalobacter thiocyanaticus TaxID=585455 RepID=A0A1Z4VU24_9GAMM|nr:iron ABC transporter permease [Thiohalobacter thiocyanaticus]BAZ95131.1 ABC-type Fe3+-siderophore transporter, permease component [Thiohalobacter thiocyanaticus]
MSVPSRPLSLLLLLALLSGLTLLLAAGLGSVELGPAAILQALLDRGPDWPRTLVWELRLPRALLAFQVGGLLALAGVLMQVLLRNPLADPYVLGTSGGAAVGALGALLLGLSGLAVQTLAFAGALLSTLVVFQLGGGLQRWHSHRLLLTGIVVAAGWGAIITFLLTIAPAERVHGLLFWLMGDLNTAAPIRLGGLWLLLLLVVAVGLGRTLNLLLLGQSTAATLGAAVGHTLVLLYVLAALATALAVSQAGSIGFVGLVIPHLIRLLGIRDHRFLIPAAALAGGSLLVLADTLGRTLLAPQQLPVGVVTAFLGVPLFLYLLTRQARATEPA